ncbi:MAG: hypothetical protein P1V97_08335 [Planctomycetota bacterium]|nr:hypothetical protein [Planctomycetota bacterium]
MQSKFFQSQSQSGWIGGPAYDLFFFFGTSLIAVGLGILLTQNPLLVAPAWWAWLLLFDGPHLISTYTRTYIDGEDRKRWSSILLVSLLFLLVGPSVHFFGRAIDSPVPFDLFLLLTALASWHHVARQNYGIMAIYQWHAKTPKLLQKLDKWFLHGSLWLLFGLFAIAHPANQTLLEIPEEAVRPIEIITIGGASILGLGTILYVLSMFHESRRKSGLKPALFLLFPVLCLQIYTFAILGAREPLFPNPTDPEQLFLAMGVVGGFVHGAQYLGIIFAVNRRRYANGEDKRLIAKAGRAPVLTYFVLVGLAGAYILLVGARGINPHWNLLDFKSDAARVCLGLYWGVFFHHYYLDQYIWKVSSDKRLREELGLTRLESSQAP